MKNKSIAKKLLLLVIIPIVALIITSIVANIELHNSQKRFDVIQIDIIPSILLLSEMNSQTAAMRSAVRDVIIGGFLEDTNLQTVQKVNLYQLRSKIEENRRRKKSDDSGPVRRRRSLKMVSSHVSVFD